MTPILRRMERRTNQARIAMVQARRQHEHRRSLATFFAWSDAAHRYTRWARWAGRLERFIHRGEAA